MYYILIDTVINHGTLWVVVLQTPRWSNKQRQTMLLCYKLRVPFIYHHKLEHIWYYYGTIDIKNIKTIH